MNVVRIYGSRFLSLILCLQLCVSCNGAGGGGTILASHPNAGLPSGGSGSASPDPSSGSTQQTNMLEISGSIVKVFHRLSDLVIPGAMAAEGKVVLYDYTNPESPEEIVSQEISGVDEYNLEVDSSLVVGKVVHLSFISNESEEKSRDLLLAPLETDKKITVSMDKASTMKAQILKMQLREEYSSGALKEVKELRSRFEEIKSKEDDSELKVVGDSDVIFKLMAQGADMKAEIARLLFYIKVAREKQDFQTLRDYSLKLITIASERNLLGDQPTLSCDDNFPLLAFKRGMKINISATDSSAEFMNRFGASVDLGGIENPEQMFDVSSKINDVLKELASGANNDSMTKAVDGAEVAMAAASESIDAISSSAAVDNVSSLEVTFTPGDQSFSPVSCRLFSRPLSPEEKEKYLSGKSPLEFDSSILMSVTTEGAGNIDELKKNVYLAFEKTVEDLKKRLVENVKDQKQIDVIFEAQNQLIRKLYEKRYNDLRQEFLGIDLSLIKDLNFDEVKDRDTAQKMLQEVVDKSIGIYKEKLSKAVDGDSTQIDMYWNQEIPKLKRLVEERQMEINSRF